MIATPLETYKHDFPFSLAAQNVQGWSNTRLPPTMLSSPFPTWILVVQFLGLRHFPLRADVQCQVAMSYDLHYSNDTSAKHSLHKTYHIFPFTFIFHTYMAIHRQDATSWGRILRSEETPAALSVKESLDLCRQTRNRGAAGNSTIVIYKELIPQSSLFINFLCSHNSCVL